MAKAAKAAKAGRGAKKSAGGGKGSRKPKSETRAAPKGVPAPAPAAAPAADTSYRLISENNLNRLLRQVESLEKQGASVTGSLREKIAYSVEKEHLHKGAFALIRRLRKMGPEARAVFMANFDHMYEVSGLEKEDEALGHLPLGDLPGGANGSGEGDGEAAEAAEPEKSGEPVSQPRFAAIEGGKQALN